jgi:hypothetical protein
MHVFAFSMLGNAKILAFVSLVHDLQTLDSSSRQNSVMSIYSTLTYQLPTLLSDCECLVNRECRLNVCGIFCKGTTCT